MRGPNAIPRSKFIIYVNAYRLACWNNNNKKSNLKRKMTTTRNKASERKKKAEVE